MAEHPYWKEQLSSPSCVCPFRQVSTVRVDLGEEMAWSRAGFCISCQGRAVAPGCWEVLMYMCSPVLVYRQLSSSEQGNTSAS